MPLCRKTKSESLTLFQVVLYRTGACFVQNTMGKALCKVLHADEGNLHSLHFISFSYAFMNVIRRSPCSWSLRPQKSRLVVPC